jgi:hypothetical protein
MGCFYESLKRSGYVLALATGRSPDYNDFKAEGKIAMIYAFSLLLLVLGLLVAVPALRKLIYMQSIRKKSEITTGQVASIPNIMKRGGTWMSNIAAVEVVNHDRPLILYQPTQGKEMSVQITPSNFLSGRKYQTGESVEVAYDLSEPWRAYPVREWTAAVRDLSLGTAITVAGVVLWILGRVYNLPF